MKNSVLKTVMMAGVMTVATCLTVSASAVKVSPTQESRDSLRRNKMKKAGKMKKDTTGKKSKTDTVGKM